MDEKESVINFEKINQIGYYQDFKIENRYCVLSEVEEEVPDFDREKQLKLCGATTLIDANPEASVLTNIQDNQDEVAPAPDEGKVTTSVTEEELATWTKVSFAIDKISPQSVTWKSASKENVKFISNIRSR